MTSTVSHDSETLAKGQQVFSVAAFIHHNFPDGQKLFMAKRALTKKFMPGVLELPGGHVDYGEEMIEGLIREVQEEFQMNIQVGDPFAVFTYMNHVKQSHSIEVIYFAQFTNPIENITFNPEDHSEFVWILEKDLDSALFGNKAKDDPEVAAIRKGFALLSGKPLAF